MITRGFSLKFIWKPSFCIILQTFKTILDYIGPSTTKLGFIGNVFEMCNLKVCYRSTPSPLFKGECICFSLAILLSKPSKCIWNCPYSLGCWLCRHSISLPLMNSFPLSQKLPTAHRPLARLRNSCLPTLSMIGLRLTWACASLKHACCLKCYEYICVTAMQYLQNTVSWGHLLLLSLRTFHDLLQSPWEEGVAYKCPV